MREREGGSGGSEREREIEKKAGKKNFLKKEVKAKRIPTTTYKRER